MVWPHKGSGSSWKVNKVSMQLTGKWGSHEWEFPCRPQSVTPKCIGVWRAFTILAGFPGKNPLNLKKHFLHSQCPWKKRPPRVYLKAFAQAEAGFWGVAQWRRCRGHKFIDFLSNAAFASSLKSQSQDGSALQKPNIDTMNCHLGSYLFQGPSPWVTKFSGCIQLTFPSKPNSFKMSGSWYDE